MNIGALIGPLVTGALWKQMGFHWGFGAAAVGMALGLIQYILMRKTTLQNAGAKAPNPLRPDERVKSWGGVIALTVIIVGLALLFPTSQCRRMLRSLQLLPLFISGRKCTVLHW